MKASWMRKETRRNKTKQEEGEGEEDDVVVVVFRRRQVTQLWHRVTGAAAKTTPALQRATAGQVPKYSAYRRWGDDPVWGKDTRLSVFGNCYPV